MAVDPSISLQAQAPQIDFAQLYSSAMQLRQMKQQMDTQNALKALLQQPDAIDPKTGQPTANTLAAVTRIDPTYGAKLSTEISETEERKAQTEHAKSETQTAQQGRDRDFLSSQVADYDSNIKGGNVAPDIALTKLKQTTHDYLYDNYPKDQADKIWSHYSNLDGAGYRNAALTAQQRYEQQQHEQTLTEERGDVTMNGKPYLQDKEGNVYDPKTNERVPITAPVIKQEPGVNPQSGAANKWEVLTDPKTNTQYRYNPDTAQSTTLDGKPYEPSGAQRLGGGTAPRSGAAAYIKAYLDDPNTDHSEVGIKNAMADYTRTQTAGTADVKAEAAGLANLGKMRASVSQAEGNAAREAGLVESLLKKGGIQGVPSALGKWQNSVRKGVFNDPDASAFQTAVESFKNEYVKVLSTTGGMSGGMSSDAARREADQYINPNLSQQQIEANIGVMKQSMANRTAAIDKAYSDTQARVEAAGKGPGSSPAELVHPTSKAEYDALPKGAHYAKPGDAPGTYRVKQ